MFAYGQTGTRKTHTMGTDCKKMEGTDVGIIPRAIKDIFAANDNISVKVSCNIFSLALVILLSMINLQINLLILYIRAYD